MNILEITDQWLEKIFFEKFKRLRNILSLISLASMFASAIAVVTKYFIPLFGFHKIIGYDPHALWLKILLYSSTGTFVILVLLLQWYETKSIKKYGRESTFSHYIEVIMAQKFANRFPSLGLKQNKPE